MTLRTILFPLPFAILWIILTNQVGIISFLIGYALAFVMGLLLVNFDDTERDVRLHNLPVRIITLIVYILVLSRDIVLSGIDVALRVIGVRPIDRTGIIAVPIQDDTESETFAGLSAHAITITPGELVVAYDQDDKIMYVHCLDIESSEQNIIADQADRIKDYRRMFGRD